MAGIRNIIILIVIYHNLYRAFGLRKITENSTQIINRLKRESSCIPDAKINNCPPEFPMYIMMSYQFTATVIPGCADSSIYYQWEANSLESDDGLTIYGSEETFFIPEFSFISGQQEIFLEITEVNDPDVEIETFRCYIDIELEDPIPIISGGNERTAVANLDYIVDGSPSINFRYENFEPIWSLECSEHTTSCTAPEKFTCPVPNSNTGIQWSFNTQSCYDYKISLALKQSNSNPTASYEQILHIVMDKDIETSHFECVSNCNNAKYLQIRIQVASVFKVICDSNCKSTAPKYVFMYRDSDQLGTIQPDRNFKTNRKVEIKKDTLEAGKKYSIIGDLNNRSTKGESIQLNLETYKHIKIACTITPTEGIALETIFKFDCRETIPKEYIFTYDIFQPNETGLFAMQSSFPVFETQLGASDGILIGVRYGKTMYSKVRKYKNIKVVANKIDKDESLKSLRMIVQTNKVFEVSQLAYLILTDGSKNLKEKENFQVQSLVLEQLIKVSINNPIDYFTMGHMTNILMRKPFTVAYAKRLKHFCNKLSKSSTVVKFDARFQYAIQADVQVPIVRSCRAINLESQATLSSDNDIITPSEGILMEGEDIITENYPNYDEEVASDIEQQAEDEEHEKVMKDAYEIAKDLRDTDEFKKNIGMTTLKINKDDRKTALEREHKFKHGTFIYLKGLPEAKSIVSMYKEIEPTSYITQDPDIATTVIEIATAIVGLDSKMKYISAPLHIAFDNLSTPYIKEIKGSVTLPSNPKNWVYDVLTNNITVHRLNVFKGHELLIEFSKLNEDTKLKVAVTQNIRPNISHFQNGFVVDESDESTWNIYPKIHTSDGNCWIYMALLIHEDTLRNYKESSVTVEYSVKFSSKSCAVWNNHYREWETGGCQLNNSSESTISCICKHSSIFSGMFTNVDSKLDPIIPVKDKLKLTTCYIVYYFVASIFALYCIAMCFSLKRNTIRNCKGDVFYLADNLKNDLYSYIVIVKTGNVRNAGTTSNIMIRLHGTKHDSKEHVLNYPDPDKQLLQRDSEQWFVLTVDQYLGEVNAIDVWFDSIGYRPCWYCDSIHVIDLQKHETCYFDVKQWLDVLIDCTHYTVKSSNENLFEDWNKKLFNNLKFHVGGNHTWNIFTRSHDADFSYIQRITCILSQILNIYVFTVIMYGSPELKMRDGFSLGIFKQVTIAGIGIFSGFISFVINVVIVVIFRHSSNGSINIYNLVFEQKLLPLWTNLLAWGLLLANIHLSLLYLVTFGFWFPMDESMQWMLSTSFGVLVNIFVFESLFLSSEEVFLKSYSRTHTVYQRLYQFNNIKCEVENQRRFLYNRFGEFLLRPYLRHLYKNLTDEVVVSKKIWNKVKLDVSSLFKDFVLFLLYFFLIYYLLVFSERMSVLYDSNQRMGRIVGEGLGHDWFNLEDINNYKDIYDYIEYTVIPALNVQFWYGEWEVRNAGTMVEIANKIIGVAQIRQQRMDFGPCENQALSCCNMSKLLCHTFISASNHTRMGTFLKPVWIYKSARETGLPSVTGILHSYDGGGFIARLGRNKRNSLHNLEYLKQRQWIDISTKVVFIDFWSYNANYNLFNVLQIIIERSRTGFMLKNYKVFTGHLLISRNINTELIRSTVVFLLICIMIATLIRQIESIIKLKGKYFKIFWNYYDWVILIMTLFTISWYIERNNMAERVIGKLTNSDNNDFVLYFHLVQTSQSLILLSALLVCLATLRIWKYLRFFTILKTFERTIMQAAGPLLVNAGYFLLIMFAYSSMGFLIFGGLHPDMNTFFKISVTLFILALGFADIDSEPEILDNYLGYLGQLYKISFMLISLLMVNIITTIIIIYLNESKQCLSNIHDPYTIFDYAKEEYRYYKELLVKRSMNLRLRGGGDNAEQEEDLLNTDEISHQADKVYAKSFEHRYSDSEKVTKSRLNSMAIISAAIIQRKLLRLGFRLNRKDYKTMAAVILNLSKTNIETNIQNDKELLFFTQKTSEDHVGIVIDYRLVKMEYVVKKLVGDIFDKEGERVVHKGEADAHKFVNISNNLRSLLDCIKSIKFMK